ncbi:right-handed parallel beta-helix repeat-containing protein [Planctomyces sp. SH-PL14]|uniref:right-handed parallel beta-helix repeat-containing protein n=1 Tax=Planctomyces sp. SH-PL14 TaxID=1632864 RepID=UPI00078C0822|nr:right-handed parallel beta-helix repeat-containing protein [Planctomyces sp. SH-PL14]AMV18099.1 Pectate lyase superfamily protein [Planctomyces sp. SH-PL14]
MKAASLAGAILVLLMVVSAQWPAQGQVPKEAAEASRDDTAALQAAIDSAKGRLDLPGGTLRLTRPLEIRLEKTGPFAIVGSGSTRILMAGPGPAIRIVGTHGGTADPKSLKPGVWDGQRMPLVDGLEIYGQHAEACGIEIDGAMQPTVTRVAVRNCLHGIHIIKRNRNVQISDCHIYDNRGVGIYLDGVNLHQINIVGSHVSYNRQGGIVLQDSEIRNIQIGTCDIEANQSLDGPPASNVLFDVTTGSVREGAIVGCTIQHDHDAPGSANIRLVGRKAEPMKVGNLSIANNVFSDVAVGIDLQYARGVSITGNTFMECYDAGVLAVGSSNVVMSANLIDRNPDYKDEVSSNMIRLRGCRDCLIDGCHLAAVRSPDGAIVLEDCQWCQVSDCSLLDCEATRVRLQNSSDCRVDSLLVRPRPEESAGPSVLVEGGDRNRVNP